ncbi:uncharacterized protein LOC113073807 isoform X1 [Carassius auratus]|uniref:ATP-dependent DNA helicase n=1 Tax=Carassius auratus TaxID=7957 RepID=A0A6P6N086_CARAU|nr:uncharacterized protein LOC113073807 isoform X1 [Carassius auratus]XP_026102348.1 uncharacterized protein LOC113073807 isoform X1 [Carassius auratus]
MPRKGKRSESQKQRRKLQSSLGTTNSTNSVSGMSEENPYVLSVKASHCQTDARYNVYSRGRQCTCNSLMFLAVHSERNELQSFDLDSILQKGDAVYTSVKQALQSKGKFVGNFLNFDELPKIIETNTRCYNILKHPQRFGFLRDTPALGNYENLENTLQCLRADVSDALLLCGNSCIAVFRDRSGRFGYFDSHCRSIYGMPVEEGTGTAVFLTFYQLQDLVDRLLILYQGCFDLRDQEAFELLPVSFISMMTESCVRIEVSLNCCDLENDVQPSVSFENRAMSNDEQCSSADAPQQYVQVQDPVQQLSETAVNRATSTDEQAHLTEVSPNCGDLEHDVLFENKALSNDEQCSSADVPPQYVQVQDPVQQLSETAVNRATSTDEQAHLTEVSPNCGDLELDVQPSFTFEKKDLSNDEQCLSTDVLHVQVQDPVQQLPQTAINRATSTDEQAHLLYKDKMEVQITVTQNQDKSKNLPLSELSYNILSQDQLAFSAPNHQNSQFAVKQTEKLNKTRKRKLYYKKWHKEMVQRQGVYDKKQAVREVYDYKTSSEYRQRQSQAMKNNYRNNINYREERKQAMKNTYKNNEKYRQNKKCKITLNYKSDEQFRERQKNYIIQNYRNREQFRERQKNYIIQNYRDREQFRERQKNYIIQNYRNREQFRERQKNYIIQNYRNREQFRERQKNYIIQNYRNREQFRERQKNYIIQNYRNREQFRERQKNYIIQNYRNREQFRERQKNYIIQNYRNLEQFRERQKNYIIQNYRDNVKYKEQLKQNLVDRYLKDPIFRQRQKDHYTNRCKNDPNFYKRRKEIFKQHYHCDAHFRARQKEYYLFKSKCKTSALKVLHKVHSAQEIKYKYKKMYLMQRQRETVQDSQHDIVQDPGMLRALNVFRDVIKQGPTYVCTCCARALFSNQVRNCVVHKYKKNPTVAALCLTGNYVHICSDCPDRCALENMKTEWICHSCHTTLLRGTMPDIAVANMLQFTPIPSELCDLNILERHVIAKYIPFAKILTLPKGQQKAIKGAVISVASEVETTVNCLPRPRSESQLLTVKLKRRLCYQGHYQYQTLNMRKVLSALSKLKEMHSEYKDIIINAALSEEEMFNEHEPSTNDISAPDEEMDVESSSQNENTEDQSNENQHNDSSDDPENTAEEQSRGLALDTCLQPPDLGQQLLSYDDGIFCIAPASKNSPVSIFKVKKLESMSFPVQFPDGKNTFDEPDRAKHVSPSRYFNTRLFSIDNRCARDTNYIFFAQFVTEMHMATSSMSIQLRKAKPMTRDGRRINCSLLQDKQELEKLVNNKEATRFMQPLRGTPAYWEKTMRDLFAMLRQLGTPTFFCTFSAAEMRWPEVITAIKAQQGETVNFDELDWSEKCEILRSNPVTAMRMFEKRVEALMRDLIMSPARPIGEVIDFFYRVEFQLRGSPHIHCLFWVKDAPEFENDEDQDVCDFIDKYISCKLPDPNKDPELHRIVSEVQMHSRNHSKSCKKNKKHCRFGFPKPPINRTTITRPRPPPAENSDDENGSEERDYATVAKEQLQKVWDLLNDSSQSFETITQLLNQANLTYEEYEKHIEALSTSSLIVMERQPQDCWVNGYNPMLLRAWNANMDIQFILNPYSCIMYMLSYISKAEHEMSDYLKRVVKDSSHDNLSDRECMKQVMNAYSKNREVSAQEAVARTCSLKLKSSSRSVIFIPTDDNAVKMSLPMRYLQTMDDDVENVWMTGLPDKYKARPNRTEFENMCMAEFASEYRIVYGGQTKGKNVLPLQKNMGRIQKRTRGKPAVIRFARFSQEKHPEKFYGTLLKLYLPYRRDEQLKSTRFTTYESFYAFASVKLPGTDELQRVFDIVNENRKKYEKHNEAIEKAIEDFEQNGPIEDAWTTLAPANELIRLESIMEREPTDPNEVNEQEDVPEYTASTSVSNTAMPLMETAQLNHAQIRRMYQSLNQTQASIFYAVRDWCKRCVSGESPQPFQYFLNGGAGVGKSHVIKSIYAEASKILRRLPCMREHTDISQPTVLLTAFTGTAAFNISGKTLHCLLKLPRSLKPPYQGLGNSLDEMRADLSNAHILIIDEISMVSKQLFAYVNWRLQQIKGNQKPFGGLSILAVGDFFQLPPLGRAKPLCVYEDHVLDFWRDHFQMITLTQIMRQRDDLAYAELLNRLRVKQKHEKLTDADKCMLEAVIRSSPEECPIDALHIYATNKEVDSHNTEAISTRFSDIINLDAHDYKKDPRTGEMKRQAVPLKGDKRDLIDTLQIAIGARVMLTRNIDVEDGLVNGTFGNVAKITAQTQGGVPVIQSIGLHLDNLTAGQKHRNIAPAGNDNIVYIERSEEPLKKKEQFEGNSP